jgi:hypothetical protein
MKYISGLTSLNGLHCEAFRPRCNFLGGGLSLTARGPNFLTARKQSGFNFLQYRNIYV